MVAESCWTVVPARSHWAVVPACPVHNLMTSRARYQVGLNDGESHPQDKDSGTHDSERHMMEEKAAPLVAGSAERLSRKRLGNRSHSSLPHGIVDSADAHLLTVHPRPDSHNQLPATRRPLVGLDELRILDCGL
jgi:hypothetical protein